MLQGIVYIQTNKNNTTLYTGVTRDLRRRVAEHKLHINKGFSYKYNTDKLVYYEVHDRLDVGIHREKQLKKWRREWKEKLFALPSCFLTLILLRSQLIYLLTSKCQAESRAASKFSPHFVPSASFRNPKTQAIRLRKQCENNETMQKHH